MSTPGGVTLQSPLSSPGKLSRQQEKEQLSDLNGRLAVFMDRVKTLRQTNDQLRKELEDAKAQAARELADARRIYEHEVGDLRRVLDETAREKAKNQISASKNEALANDLKAKLQAETEALNDTQRNLRSAQQEANKKDGELKAALADVAEMKRAKKDLQKERDEAKRKADDARAHLEEETVARVDAENNMQSLREDMEFKQQLSDRERADLAAKLQAKEQDLKNTIAEFQARLDEQHTKELDDLREQFDHDLTEQRQELERAADEKCRLLQERSDREKALGKSLMDENRKLRDDAQKLADANTTLDAKNGELQKRLDSAEKERQAERARQDRRRRELEEEMAAVQAENDGYRRAYDDLLDVQTRVDNEIQTYSALMEMEMPRKAAKRRRPAQEQEETVGVVISEVSSDYIKLTNTGGKDTPMGSWKIVRGENTYKFGNRFILKGHATVHVWAVGSGRTHRPPKDIVFKHCQQWQTGDDLPCTLLNSDGQIHHLLQGTSQTKDTIDGGGPESYDRPEHLPQDEDIFHQQGDPSPDKQNCVIC